MLRNLGVMDDDIPSLFRKAKDKIDHVKAKIAYIKG